MEFTTELAVILPLIPAMIIYLTWEVKKNVRGSLVFLLPYGISFILFSGLYFAFNDFAYSIYIVNSFIFAFGATSWYDFAKKSIKRKIEKQNTLAKLQSHNG
jgi:predicted RND superfamily exporter protein